MPIGTNAALLLPTITPTSGSFTPAPTAVDLSALPKSPVDFDKPRFDPTTGQAQWYSPGIAGFGQHIDDAIQQPGMKSALLRAAGALFSGGGVGGAIDAGAGYMDKQKATAAAAGQQQFENAMSVLKQQTADNEAKALATHYGASDTNQALDIWQRARHATASNATTRRGQDITAQTAAGQQATERANTAANNATSLATNAATNAASTANNQRTTEEAKYAVDNAASKPVATVRLPAVPAVSHWFSANEPGKPGGTTQVFSIPQGATPQSLEIGKAYSNGKSVGVWTGSAFQPLAQ